jgi:UDP-glucose 4-epimerase
MEQQADAFARRFEWMTISSFRFHWLLESREQAIQITERSPDLSIRHLWSYTLLSEASRAILLSLTADFKGHEVFYITAPQTASPQLSSELAHQHYPQVEIRGDFAEHSSFFNCNKAEQLLAWKHQEN